MSKELRLLKREWRRMIRSAGRDFRGYHSSIAESKYERAEEIARMIAAFEAKEHGQ